MGNIWKPGEARCVSMPTWPVDLPEGVGLKFDNNKLRWDLLPMEIIEEVVKILTLGAVKYEDYNWQRVDNPKERYFAAAMRHIVAWRKGEINDPEMDTHHLANAISNLIFLIHFDNKQNNEKSGESK